jgi:DNA-binding MarR family transcriptional regulator
MGYVKRSRDPTDERQVRVQLTKAGAALRGKARDIPSCILEASAFGGGITRASG